MENLGRILFIPMRRIDDKMIEKALRNLKLVRRGRPFFGILGVVCLVQAGLLGHLLYLYVQKPWHSSGTSVFGVAYMTFLVGFILLTGVRLLCMGLFRDYKDIILEHLAERYLKEQKKNEERPEKDPG